MSENSATLSRIDAYLDTVPRPATRAEELGPFTLFVNEGIGWRYYARPTLGATAFTAADVEIVLARQRALDQPMEFEWIVEVTPGVGPAASAAGLHVVERPLMHVPAGDFRPKPAPADVLIGFASADDDLATISSLAIVAFGAPGTEVAPIGIDALPEAARGVDAGTVEFVRGRVAGGLTITAVASVDGVPVASGSHQPVGDVTEIVGVACLPAFRRRGLGAAVTSALASDAFARGVSTVFLSADDGTIARIYDRLGFRTIGRVEQAAPPE